MDINWNILSNIAQILTAIIAYLGVCKGFREYKEIQKQKRIQYLLDFGKRYTENNDITDVIKCLESLEDNREYDCSNVDIHKVELYMRFIEELELLIESNSVDESAALYLFGYYTKILEDNQHKWQNLNYNKEYWNKFREFTKKTKNFNYKNATL